MDKARAAKVPLPPLPADSILRNGNEQYMLGRFLGKVVHKTMLTKPHQKEKMLQEIRIHRKLSHKFVVKFFSHFEDTENVYVLLELCTRRSLMEVLKRRGRLTYQETRYFMYQLLDGVSYLHNIKIIHRDLKLGNLFLTGDIQLRIGDFGLATQLDHEHERRQTLCGTPNYIAPEILEKVGHSYEVDIWSCGCILYTLLVGKPPFETPHLRQTYAKIQKVEYRIDPKLIPPLARQMIESMLQKKPQKRPSAVDALRHQFFTESPLPAALPESILTTEPRFNLDRRVLGEICAANVPPVANGSSAYPERMDDQNVALQHIKSLEEQLAALMHSGFVETELLPMDQDNAADPAAMPVYWSLRRRQYMQQHLLTAGADAPAAACMKVARVPYLRVWFRTQSAIVLFLSNGTLQLNFFQDHTKIILCPLMGAVSYIDKVKNFRTYSLQTMHQACPTELSVRLKYAQSICTKLTYQETRYFMYQLLDGVSYLHNIKIIHRDLKLGNLFLTGLDHEHERRQTPCGTPNYIAPEILEKVGHSYELARQMIESMLQKKPQKRPSAVDALRHQFFTESPLPAALPESILTTEPRFNLDRRVLGEICAANVPPVANGSSAYPERMDDQNVALQHIKSLEEQLAALMHSGFVETELLPMDQDNAADPAAMPVYWVAKWVDYTDKYRLGYQLCDNSLAVLCNDRSRMVLLGDMQVHYIDHRNRESYHTMTKYPAELEKKVVLLKYFRLLCSGDGETSQTKRNRLATRPGPTTIAGSASTLGLKGPQRLPAWPISAPEGLFGRVFSRTSTATPIERLTSQCC
ncbi:serine/threonine-protein kinase PLK1-like [Tropilaelaps mercedesae]|uniref:polo kinase n=1 Tax=Tropilaelaps mercedesae TaxID=418985 RepID=A0A1V9XNW7_9ACAR|nr:serine/threonine-protein kinase PLK1-like [Tropilaelaps mercedesae]